MRVFVDDWFDDLSLTGDFLRQHGQPAPNDLKALAAIAPAQVFVSEPLKRKYEFFAIKKKIGAVVTAAYGKGTMAEFMNEISPTAFYRLLLLYNEVGVTYRPSLVGANVNGILTEPLNQTFPDAAALGDLQREVEAAVHPSFLNAKADAQMFGEQLTVAQSIQAVLR